MTEPLIGVRNWTYQKLGTFRSSYSLLCILLAVLEVQVLVLADPNSEFRSSWYNSDPSWVLMTRKHSYNGDSLVGLLWAVLKRNFTS